MKKIFIEDFNSSIMYSRNVHENGTFRGIELNPTYSRAKGFWIEVVEETPADFKRLNFVHGNITELKEGKTCVVRNSFFWSDSSVISIKNDMVCSTAVWTDLKGYENTPFKSIKTQEGKLVVVGETKSNNFKIKLYK